MVWTYWWVDISPKAGNTQDIIQGPHEAQKGGRPMCGWFNSSEKGNKILTGADIEIKCRDWRKGGPETVPPGYSSFIQSLNPIHYCGCQEMLAERTLIWQSPERPCQSLIKTEVHSCSQPLDGVRGLSTMVELEKGPKEMKGFATS